MTTQRLVFNVPLRRRDPDDHQFEIHVADLSAPAFMIGQRDVIPADQVYVADGQWIGTVRLMPGLVAHLRNWGLNPVDLQPDGNWIVDSGRLIGDEVVSINEEE